MFDQFDFTPVDYDPFAAGMGGEGAPVGGSGTGTPDKSDKSFAQRVTDYGQDPSVPWGARVLPAMVAPWLRMGEDVLAGARYPGDVLTGKRAAPGEGVLSTDTPGVSGDIAATKAGTDVASVLQGGGGKAALGAGWNPKALEFLQKGNVAYTHLEPEEAKIILGKIDPNSSPASILNQAVKLHSAEDILDKTSAGSWSPGANEFLAKGGDPSTAEAIHKSEVLGAQTILNKHAGGQELSPAAQPWLQIGPRLGSNPGGKFLDPQDVERYMKFYKDPEQGKSEALATKIFNGMGAPALKMEPHNVNGKMGVGSEWNPDLTPVQDWTKLSPPQQDDLARHFTAAILTKNWDVLGMDMSNLAANPATNQLVHTDAGGAFNFRAQGATKPYGTDIGELKSFLDGTNPQTAEAFKNLPPHWKQIALQSMGKLENNPGEVSSWFTNSGLKNAPDLWNSFWGRFKNLKEALSTPGAEAGTANALGGVAPGSWTPETQTYLKNLLQQKPGLKPATASAVQQMISKGPDWAKSWLATEHPGTEGLGYAAMALNKEKMAAKAGAPNPFAPPTPVKAPPSGGLAKLNAFLDAPKPKSSPKSLTQLLSEPTQEQFNKLFNGYVPPLKAPIESSIAPPPFNPNDLPMDKAAVIERMKAGGFGPIGHDWLFWRGAGDVNKKSWDPAAQGWTDPITKEWEKGIFLAPDVSSHPMGIPGQNAAAKYKGSGVTNAHVVRAQNPKIMDMKGKEYGEWLDNELTAAWKKGHDAVLFKNMKDTGGNYDQLVVRKPNQLRHPYAAFDPMFAHTNNLLAARGIPVPGEENKNENGK